MTDDALLTALAGAFGAADDRPGHGRHLSMGEPLPGKQEVVPFDPPALRLTGSAVGITSGQCSGRCIAPAGGELATRAPSGLGTSGFALYSPGFTPMPSTHAAERAAPSTVRFSLKARSEPGVMPRVLELFAKRGLVP